MYPLGSIGNNCSFVARDGRNALFMGGTIGNNCSFLNCSRPERENKAKMRKNLDVDIIYATQKNRFYCAGTTFCF